VLIKASDRCGNVAIQEFHLKTATPPSAARPVSPPEQAPAPQGDRVQLVTNQAKATPEASPAGQPTGQPAVQPATKQADPGDGPAPAPPSHKDSAVPGTLPPSLGPELNSSKIYGPGNATGPRQLLNTTKASVEYKFDNVGASGVGKVEVYIT